MYGRKMSEVGEEREENKIKGGFIGLSCNGSTVLTFKSTRYGRADREAKHSNCKNLISVHFYVAPLVQQVMASVNTNFCTNF